LPNTVEEELLARGAVDSASASDVVCLANGWCSWKNVAGALRAFSIVHRYVPEARLQLIGVDMGPEGPASEYAHREGLRDGVDFVGPLPHSDAVDRLARAAVYFHPSLEESFGQAVLEAMALGRPIVAHDRAGNVPYLLERGRFGLLCDARAPEKAAAAVIGLLEERDAAMRLGRAARAQARSCYSRAAVVGRYMAHYAQVLRADVGMSGADAQDPDVGGVR
jgi:glycosyltransferase involved in cell wall biosynthesis